MCLVKRLSCCVALKDPKVEFIVPCFGVLKQDRPNPSSLKRWVEVEVGQPIIRIGAITNHLPINFSNMRRLFGKECVRKVPEVLFGGMNLW